MSQAPHRFTLLEIPSKGSSGIVCTARCSEGREWAIKVLYSGRRSDKAILSRARDEARILSRLQHPNLVTVEPALVVNGRQAIIMEYVRGSNMEAILQQFGPVPPAIAMTVIRDAARGLHAAWSTPGDDAGSPMQIIHRDLKPGNIMISIDGIVKVVDFGIAKATFKEREARSVAFVPGSRGYMAPERFDSEDTQKGDVYSLGLTFAELLTGKVPILSLRMDRHDSNLESALNHVSFPSCGEQTEPLKDLVRSMCSYESEARPEMNDVAERIDALLERMPPADMKAFATRTAAAIFSNRTSLPAPEHPLYPHVRFLEADPELFDADNIDDEIRKIVNSAEFPERSLEVAALFANNDKLDATPVIDVLNAGTRKSWMFWTKRESPARVHAALQAISPVLNPTLINTISALTEHNDPQVSSLARELMASR